MENVKEQQNTKKIKVTVEIDDELKMNREYESTADGKYVRGFTQFYEGDQIPLVHQALRVVAHISELNYKTEHGTGSPTPVSHHNLFQEEARIGGYNPVMYSGGYGNYAASPVGDNGSHIGFDHDPAKLTDSDLEPVSGHAELRREAKPAIDPNTLDHEIVSEGLKHTKGWCPVAFNEFTQQYPQYNQGN